MANLILISPLILLLLTPLASTTTLSLDNPTFPSTDAKNMIRDFNLFPKQSINIVEDGDDTVVRSSVADKKLVEKRFMFPDFVDLNGVSVDDLGHHAGYYQIEHSHAARYILRLKIIVHLLF